MRNIGSRRGGASSHPRSAPAARWPLPRRAVVRYDRTGMEDPYKILGVRRGDSDDDIRAAYRKLAKKHHPDVNAGDKASEEKFKRVSAAFTPPCQARSRPLE